MYPYKYFQNIFRNYMNIPYTFAPQHQDLSPGIESIMIPVPISDDPNYIGSNKLIDKIAIVTGGDSGIGRAVSIAFAKEGANLVIVYLSDREYQDALFTKKTIENYGRKAILIQTDLTDENNCEKVINETLKSYNKLDILVNNAGTAYIENDITKIEESQLTNTFKTNIFSQIYMSKYAVMHMNSGSCIINTASIVALEPVSNLISYSASKGASVTFTKTLAMQLISKGIRVNAVAPTYTWTPLITTTVSAEQIINFGRQSPMKRAAQPFELAPAYVYLASDINSSYITGKILYF